MKRLILDRGSRWVAGVIVLAAWIAQTPSSAAAYCRSSLGAMSSDGDCEEDPSQPFLFWDRNCVTYTFNNRIFGRLPQLGESGTRQAFASAFASWAAVDCGRGALFFVPQAAATTATDKSEFVYDVRNEFVVNALTRDEWAALPSHNLNVIAVTLIWHNTRTGEILDVDMELNLGQGSFADCSSLTQPCRFGMVDLQNTVTHEAGHVLGLGHSKVPGATMEAQTSSNLAEITKRTLEADDRAGYCALELPLANCVGASCVCPAPPIFPSKTSKQSCGCSVLGSRSEPQRSWLGGAALVALMLAAVRRRRSRIG